MTTLEAIGLTLAGGTCVFAVSLSLFGVAVAERCSFVAPRCTARPADVIYNPSPSHPCQDRGGPMLGWVPWTLSLTYDTMLRGIPGTGTRKGGLTGELLKVNMDGVVLLRFHAMGLRIATLAMALFVLVLIPVYWTARCSRLSNDNLTTWRACSSNYNLTSFDRTTLANIPALLDLPVVLSGDADELHASSITRLYIVVLCSWIVTWFSCYQLHKEWISLLAMRRVYYLEYDHWRGRKEELQETMLVDVDEEQLKTSEPHLVHRDPWIPHPEQRDTVPNVALYSVLIGGLPSLPTDVLSEDNVEEAVGSWKQVSMDWQLAVTSSFFDHCVPNPPGYSSSVAAVTILPAAAELATAWKRWYVAAGKLRRLRFIRRRIAELRHYDIEDDKDDSNTDCHGNDKKSRCRQRNTGTRAADCGAADDASVDIYLDSEQNRRYYQHVLGVDNGVYLNGKKDDDAEDVEADRQDDEYLGIPFGPEQTAVYSREFAQSAAQCCPNGCFEGRVWSASIDELIEMEEDVMEEVHEANVALRKARQRVTVADEISQHRSPSVPLGQSLHCRQDIEETDNDKDVVMPIPTPTPTFSRGTSKTFHRSLSSDKLGASSLHSSLEAKDAPKGLEMELQLWAKRYGSESNASVNASTPVDPPRVSASASTERVSNKQRRQQSPPPPLQLSLHGPKEIQPQTNGHNQSRKYYPKQQQQQRLPQQQQPQPQPQPQQSFQHQRDHQLCNFQQNDHDSQSLADRVQNLYQQHHHGNRHGFHSQANRHTERFAPLSPRTTKSDASNGSLLLPLGDVGIAGAHHSVSSPDGTTRRRANSAASEAWDLVESIVRQDGSLGSSGARTAVASSRLQTPSARADDSDRPAAARVVSTGVWEVPTVRGCWNSTSKGLKNIWSWMFTETTKAVDGLARDSTYAVVTFTSRQAALAARYCLADARGRNRWVAVDSIPVPPLADAAACDLLLCRGCCRPVTLSLNNNQKRIRHYVAMLTLAAMYVFYTIPLAATTSLVDPERLGQIFPKFEEWSNESPEFQRFFSGVVPALIWTLFFSLCPVIFKSIANFGSNATSVMSAEFRALQYFWWFMVVTAFSGSSLATMVLNGFSDGVRIGAEAQQVVANTAATIPTQVSATWLNWIIFRFTIILPLHYLLQVNTFLFNFLGWNCCSRLVRGGGSGPPVPYRVYVDSGVVLLCVFALAPASPLVAPAAFFYFIISEPILRRNLIFMYKPKFDAGGIRWPILFDMVISAMLVGQILLTAMIGLKQAVVPAVGAALPIIPTIWFRLSSRERFLQAFRDVALLQTSLLDGWNMAEPLSLEKREEFRKFLVDAHKAAYVPVCIAGDETDIITAEPAVVVPTEADMMLSSANNYDGHDHSIHGHDGGGSYDHHRELIQQFQDSWTTSPRLDAPSLMPLPHPSAITPKISQSLLVRDEVSVGGETITSATSGVPRVAMRRLSSSRSIQSMSKKAKIKGGQFGATLRRLTFRDPRGFVSLPDLDHLSLQDDGSVMMSPLSENGHREET